MAKTPSGLQMNKLKATLKEHHITAKELAARVDMEPPAIRRYVRGELVPSIDLAAKISAALNMDQGELWDLASPSSNGRTVPVYGAAQAGKGEDISDISSPMDYEPSPPTINAGGYGVYVSGQSMSPRLSSGDLVFAAPGRPIKEGDLVVVQYRDDGDLFAIVKEYVEHNATTLTLLQSHPKKAITIPQGDVAEVHRVVTVNFT